MKEIQIGKFKINEPIIPAPMCGIMDFPFREIISKFGAPLLYTEMLSSDAINIKDKKEYIKHSSKKNYSNNIPFVIQIAGHDSKIMAEAAKICEELEADIIDMNFGCPVKKVVNGFAGSALMKDLKKSKEIIKETVNAVKIPVTIKMRLGWDFDSLNFIELAKIAQEEGCKSITIHCRTRSQMYTGNADWLAIKNLKEVIKIPIIVNGDITDLNSLKTALEKSNADGAMIARGLYGKPWLIAQLIDNLKNKNTKEIKPINIFKEVIEHHVNLLEEHYKEKAVGFIIKHLYFYSKNIINSAEFRRNISKLNKTEDILKEAKIFFHNL